MNLFMYVLAIALSWAFPVDLSPTFILNSMQLFVQLPLGMISCQIAFLFLTLSSTGVGNMQICQNRLCLKFHSLQMLLLIF